MNRHPAGSRTTPASWASASQVPTLPRGRSYGVGPDYHTAPRGSPHARPGNGVSADYHAYDVGLDGFDVALNTSSGRRLVTKEV